MPEDIPADFLPPLSANRDSNPNRRASTQRHSQRHSQQRHSAQVQAQAQAQAQARSSYRHSQSRQSRGNSSSSPSVRQGQGQVPTAVATSAVASTDDTSSYGDRDEDVVDAPIYVGNSPNDNATARRSSSRNYNPEDYQDLAAQQRRPSSSSRPPRQRNGSVESNRSRGSARNGHGNGRPISIAMPMEQALQNGEAGYEDDDVEDALFIPGSHHTLTDAELARLLQSQFDQERGSMGGGGGDEQASAHISRMVQQEIEDNRLAQQMLDEEIAMLQDRAAHRGEEDDYDGYHGWEDAAAIGVDPNLDYMRPTNYKPYFSAFIFVACCMMMIAEFGENEWQIESLAVNPTVGPSTRVLLELGAKDTELIVNEGEWWRLIAPMFLHAGIIHLLFNMLGLLNIGVPAEREFGTWRIAMIYFVSGFVGVLLSAIFLPKQISVGASGSIFGLFGAAWADLIQNWALYRGAAWKAFFQLLITTLINMVLGLVPFLDNFAHVGGMLAGLITGLALLVQNRYTRFGARKKRKSYQTILQAVALISVPVISLALLLTLYLGIDASERCEWCNIISCVQFPPGVSPEELWWDCGDCAEAQGQAFENGTLKVNCPEGDTVFGEYDTESTPTTQDVIELCRVECLG